MLGGQSVNLVAVRKVRKSPSGEVPLPCANWLSCNAKHDIKVAMYCYAYVRYLSNFSDCVGVGKVVRYPVSNSASPVPTE